MALPQSQRDREYTNFKDNEDGTTSRYVYVVDGGVMSDILVTLQDILVALGGAESSFTDGADSLVDDGGFLLWES